MQFGRRNGRRLSNRNQSPTHILSAVATFYGFYGAPQMAFQPNTKIEDKLLQPHERRFLNPLMGKRNAAFFIPTVSTTATQQNFEGGETPKKPVKLGL